MFLDNVFRNTKRYIGLFCEAVDDLMVNANIHQQRMDLEVSLLFKAFLLIL